MRKIPIIVAREYLSRVKTKAFLFSTFLSPLLMGLLIFIPILATENSGKEKLTVYVEDNDAGESAMRYIGKRSDEYITFIPATESKEYYRDSLGENQALLELNSTFKEKQNVNFVLRTRHSLGLGAFTSVESKVTAAVREFRLDSSGISKEEIEKLNVKANVIQQQFEGQDEIASAEVASGIGYAMSFMIYLLLIIYGASVMRGVVEEKSSRIAEVILSTVRPFELMLGKIIGIGAVGMTQFLIWIFMLLGITFAAGLFIGMNPEMIQSVQAGAPTPDAAAIERQADLIRQIFLVLNWKTILLFLFYFLGGYLLYGSLFAAVGSAVDQEADSQNLTWPVTIPLILPMMLLGNILQNPSGGLARFMSLFPLFSPSTMMVRYASQQYQTWELVLSMILLVLGFIGGVWVAARIYRVGILMYGKKATLKELWKWLRHY